MNGCYLPIGELFVYQSPLNLFDFPIKIAEADKEVFQMSAAHLYNTYIHVAYTRLKILEAKRME